MIDRTIYSIFQEGSKTYFYSSMFFPSVIKKEVFSLYGFVRKADNFADSIPQDVNGFYEFKEKYYKSEKGNISGDIVIDSFIKLKNEKIFESSWIGSFLKSMEMDITRNAYQTIDETLEYIYGSAEVIGLFMSKIMDLPKEAYRYAKYLGKSMQYINFIRDISEDNKLGRNYFPQDELNEFGLKSLNYEDTKKQKENYTNFIHKQIKRYCEWQHIAEEGYKYIPKRYLIPVKTASEMYNWTALQIYNNPYIVYKMKVKPMIKHIFSRTLMNIIDPRKTNNKKGLCIVEKLPQQINQ